MAQDRITKGGCLCGGVTYTLHGALRGVVVCHCHQCRKSSGHYAAATQTLADKVEIAGDKLRWFRSSEEAERGFCSVCGSNLFWRRRGNPHISIFAGTIDGETGLRMESQLYPESAGDYYTLPDVPVLDQASLT